MRHNTVLVDLDGVLARNEQPWQGPDVIEPPRPEALEFLGALQQRGYHVVVWTCRDKLIACRWLVEHKLMDYVDEIQDNKPNIAFVIDDRAIDGRQPLPRVLYDMLKRWEDSDAGDRRGRHRPDRDPDLLAG